MEKKSKLKIVGIILAAGRGTRINSHEVNKVCLQFNGQSLIVYAAKLMQQVADKTIVVVGAFSQSVKQSLLKYRVSYVNQDKQLGTANAVKVVIDSLEKIPDLVLVGYGDHMMFYTPQTVEQLVKLHLKTKAIMSLVSVTHVNPNELAWGRIIRDKNASVVDSREHKDASEQEKQITELNAGFYCFDCKFLQDNLNKVIPSPISKEYYINALVKIAVDQNLIVSALKVPFSDVGIGINKQEELKISEKLYKNNR